MTRIEVAAAAEVLDGAVARFEEAYWRWQKAVARRGRVAELGARQIRVATGGLGLYRFERALDRRRIYNSADARLLAGAVRAEPAVRSAVADAARRQAVENDSVLSARSDLVVASKELLRCGQLAVCRSGISERELRRLARRPTGSPRAAS